MTAAPACVLRADAGPEIGLGHVARCLSLAEAWTAEGGEAALLSAGLAPAVAAWFEARGVAVVALPAGVAPGSAEDALATRAEAAARGAGAIVVDGYHFDAGYLAALRAPGLITAYVDDLLRRGLPVDVLVNPNAGAHADDYGAGGPAEILAGARYTPLREEFRAARRPRTGDAARAPLHLLITFGGSDPAGMTVRALEAAIAVGAERFDPITVLVGPLYPSIAALRDLAGAAGRGGREGEEEGEGFTGRRGGGEEENDAGSSRPDSSSPPPRLPASLLNPSPSSSPPDSSPPPRLPASLLNPSPSPSPSPRVNLRSVSPGEVAAVLAGVDVALGAAGSTSWELACLGVPMLLVEVADNQRAVIAPLAACGAAWALGAARELTAGALADALGRLAAAGEPARRAMAEAGARLVDGEGARRVAAALAARVAAARIPDPAPGAPR